MDENIIVGTSNAGIQISSSTNTVVQGDLIVLNGGQGLLLDWQSAASTLVTKNQIAGNAGLGIAIDFTGDAGYPAAELLDHPRSEHRRRSARRPGDHLGHDPLGAS